VPISSVSSNSLLGSVTPTPYPTSNLGSMVKLSLDDFFSALRVQAESPEELAVIREAEAQAKKLFQDGKIGSTGTVSASAWMAWSSSFPDPRAVPRLDDRGTAESVFKSMVLKKIAAMKKAKTVDPVLYLVKTIFVKNKALAKGKDFHARLEEAQAIDRKKADEKTRRIRREKYLIS
jgi:hypothetical protein